MYILMEYNSNYFETKGSLCFCSKDETTSFNRNIENTNDFKPFKYKVKLFGNPIGQPNPNQANGILKNVTVPLKYVSNFWRSLRMPLKIKWINYCFVCSW